MEKQKQDNKVVDNQLMISPAFLTTVCDTIVLCRDMLNQYEPPVSQIRQLYNAFKKYQDIPFDKRKINEDYCKHLIRVINWGYKYMTINCHLDDDKIDDKSAGLTIAEGVLNFFSHLHADMDHGCLSKENYNKLVDYFNQRLKETSQNIDQQAKRFIK